MNKTSFAVISNNFALYKVFKEECEKIGWTYLNWFTEFSKDSATTFECILFSTKFLNNADYGFAFSEGVFGMKLFNLDGQFEEALDYAKKIFDKNKEKNITYDDVARELFYNKNTYYNNTCEGILNINNISDFINSNNAATPRQLQKLMALNKLMNVAVYVNEGREYDHHWYITITPLNKILYLSTTMIYGAPLFNSWKAAKKAVKILGEDVIRLALT